MRQIALSLAVLVGVVTFVPGDARGASPSAVPIQPGLITWERAADTTGAPAFADGITPLDLAWGGSGLLLLAADPGESRQVWSSADGHTWTSVATGLEVPADVTLDGVAADRTRAWVHGHGLDGRVRMWTSTDGVGWVALDDTDLAAFGDGVVTSVGDDRLAYGYAQDGRHRVPTVWTTRNGTRWRHAPRVVPADPAVALRLGIAERGRLVTRLPTQDATLVPVRRADGVGWSLWRTTNDWDWEQATVPPGADPGSDRIAWASDGSLLALADSIDAAGGHSLAATADGLTWLPAVPEGDMPLGGGQLLATRFGAVMLATDQGAWLGTWPRHPSNDLPTPPPPPGFGPVGPIGAAPPLRPAVRPTGRIVRPTLGRAADVRVQRGRVSLAMWLPHRRVRSGDVVVARIRFVNHRDHPIVVDCGPTETHADLAALFPPGRTWAGEVALLKVNTLRSSLLGDLWFRYRIAGRTECPLGSDVGQQVVIPPGARRHTRSPSRCATCWRTSHCPPDSCPSGRS